MTTAEQIKEALKECMDPELYVSIVDLGLVYNIDIKDNENVNILMTLTSPGCPMGSIIIKDVQARVEKIGFKNVKVDLTFEPPWTPDKMTKEGKSLLGMA
jgi:metal-sulfur cluster biosynthetic enzyme